MDSIGLLFKVLWSPGEAMFLLSKRPRVLAPLLFACFCSFLTGAAFMTKVDSGELALRMIERGGRGSSLTDEQKATIQRQANLPIFRTLGFITTGIGPVLTIAVIAAIYFALFTMVGREGTFKAYLSITAYAFVP